MNSTYDVTPVLICTVRVAYCCLNPKTEASMKAEWPTLSLSKCHLKMTEPKKSNLVIIEWLQIWSHKTPNKKLLAIRHSSFKSLFKYFVYTRKARKKKVLQIYHFQAMLSRSHGTIKEIAINKLCGWYKVRTEFKNQMTLRGKVT